MKLSEIKRTSPYDTCNIKDIDFFDHADLKPFSVKVIYEYEDSSTESHPYGEGSADEKFDNSISIIKIETTTKVEQLDFETDDEKVIKTFPIGFDVTKLPGWEEDFYSLFQEKVLKINH